MTHNSGNYRMGWSKINEEVNQILRDEELLLQQQRLSFLFARFHYIVFFFFFPFAVFRLVQFYIIAYFQQAFQYRCGENGLNLGIRALDYLERSFSFRSLIRSLYSTSTPQSEINEKLGIYVTPSSPEFKI